MPSTRLTKTNIDRDTLSGMQLMADAQGLSTAQLIDKIWLEYLSKHTGKHDAAKSDQPQEA